MRLPFSPPLLCLIAAVGGCNPQANVSETVSFSCAAPNSAPAVGFSCEDVAWAAEDILVATSGNRMIQAFDANSGTEKWRKEFSDDVCAIACSKSHVFVVLDGSTLAESKSDRIRRFESQSGEDQTPPGIPQPFLPDAMAWIEETDSICVLMNEGIWIYSSDLQNVIRKVAYEGNPFFSAAGGFALLAERGGSCTLADLTAGTTTTVHGTPHVTGSSMIAIDAPFLSNAFADGKGKLIRVVDNSWSTGSVAFHKDRTSKPTTVDSGNGHAIAAVHWPTRRLAVSGTEQNLLLFDTSGKRLTKIGNAVTERTYAMAFSPSGSKIATLGSDGGIKVFATSP